MNEKFFVAGPDIVDIDIKLTQSISVPEVFLEWHRENLLLRKWADTSLSVKKKWENFGAQNANSLKITTFNRHVKAIFTEGQMIETLSCWEVIEENMVPL